MMYRSLFRFVNQRKARLISKSIKIQSMRWLICVIALFTFFTQISVFVGEDIVNARNNYLTGSKIDFWGGISTLVYAHIPDLGFRWQIWLAIGQILFTSIGLFKFFEGLHNRPRLVLLNLLVIYSALMFGSQMTRDGLMFSLLVLGFGILKTKKNNGSSFIALLVPILVILFALSFRPWIAMATLPLLLVLINHKIKVRRVLTITLILIVSVIPLVLEIGTTKALGLTRSFPEQQVMVMDVAATYCYTNNLATGERAKSALGIFSKDPAFLSSACQLYRPDTWVSLTRSDKASAEGLQSDFALISPDEKKKYELLKSTWSEMILRDPVTYLQNKILFIGKLLVGSDSRNFNLNTSKNLFSNMSALFRLPFEIPISLHLYSIAFCLFWILLLPIRNFVSKKEEAFSVHRVSISLISTVSLWSILSSIAYIGSNGRYTYSITILSLVFLLSHFNGSYAGGKKA